MGIFLCAHVDTEWGTRFNVDFNGNAVEKLAKHPFEDATAPFRSSGTTGGGWGGGLELEYF